jgi:hypothetical protein
VCGVAVLFPVNALSNNFTSLGYTAPSGITNHYVAGLRPNISYTVTVQTNSGPIQVTVTAGPGVTADNVGLLSFDNSGKALNLFVPRWLSAQWVNGGLQLNGLGGSLLPYQVLAGTNLTTPNWTTIGTATADASGALQFLHTSPAPATERFYRLAR